MAPTDDKAKDSAISANFSEIKLAAEEPKDAPATAQTDSKVENTITETVETKKRSIDEITPADAKEP